MKKPVSQIPLSLNCMWLHAAWLFTALLCACSTSPPSSPTASVPANYSIKNPITLPDSCIFDDRADAGTVIDAHGTIIRIMDQYGIGTQRVRYYPCNLPPVLRHEGLAVRFSGKIKIMLPNERWAAQPFKISQIAHVAE